MSDSSSTSATTGPANPEDHASDAGPESGPQAPATDFERRERERRARRVARYDELADWRLQHLATRHYYSERLRRLVQSLVLPGARVLEVGCGLGDLLAVLDASEAVGIDVSPRMIQLAKKRHPELDLRVLDVEHDALPEGPFDAIVLSDVVGHLHDIQHAFERLAPLLAPGGRVVVTYYNFLWEPLLQLAEKVGLKTAWPDQNWLSMADIENLLALADFEVFRRGTDILLPVDVPGSAFVNRVAAKLPGVRHAALVDHLFDDVVAGDDVSGAQRGGLGGGLVRVSVVVDRARLFHLGRLSWWRLGLAFITSYAASGAARISIRSARSAGGCWSTSSGSGACSSNVRPSSCSSRRHPGERRPKPARCRREASRTVRRHRPSGAPGRRR